MLLTLHHPQATILDKTVEKIVYLDSIFLKIVAVPVLPSPPSPESNVVVYSKESLIPGRLWEATLNWGKGFSFRKGVVLEIVLLRRKVDMMGKTFSSSFVRDCSFETTVNLLSDDSPICTMKVLSLFLNTRLNLHL